MVETLKDINSGKEDLTPEAFLDKLFKQAGLFDGSEDFAKSILSDESDDKKLRVAKAFADRGMLIDALECISALKLNKIEQPEIKKIEMVAQMATWVIGHFKDLEYFKDRETTFPDHEFRIKKAEEVAAAATGYLESRKQITLPSLISGFQRGSPARG